MGHPPDDGVRDYLNIKTLVLVQPEINLYFMVFVHARVQRLFYCLGSMLSAYHAERLDRIK